MKTYTGTRAPGGCLVTVTDDNGIVQELPMRLDLRNHSPSGAEWGYTGSGPAQLALALAADVLGDDDQAHDVYQELGSDHGKRFTTRPACGVVRTRMMVSTFRPSGGFRNSNRP